MQAGKVLAASMTGSQTWLGQPNRLRDFVIIVLFLLVIGLGWIQLDNLWNSPLTIPISSLRSMPVNSTKGMLEFLVSSQRAMVSQLQQTLNTTDFLLERMEQLEKTTSTYKHELELQRNRTFGLENKLQWLDQVSQLFSKHLRNPHFYPVKDVIQVNAKSGIYAFMSEVEVRGKQSGPPELFYFPSNISQNRLLCVKGNHTSDGTKNLYGYAYKEALPADVVLLPGITLITDSRWDFANPWHSMYNLIQFLYWKVDHSCASANQLLLYHWGELRATMGYWISNVYKAIALPFVPESLSYDGRPVCFEQAVVSKIGIGGVPSEILQDLFAEMRCESRRYCNFTVWKDNSSAVKGMQVTLMVRTGVRSFVDLSAWENVVKMECEKVPGCRWVSMHVANLTFCQQVEIMSDTDVLVSVHGAQLTNMIFMNPGGRIMEMFPKGWLELAGHGQYIYRNLANWVGLQHEGYWRDPETPDCPDQTDAKSCFSFYKNQNVGINVTHHSTWLGNIIADLNKVKTDQQISSSKSHDTSAFSACKC